MNMAQREIERALQIVRKCGAERPGHARSQVQDARLRGAIEAAPLVALGPDSTDQTARARSMYVWCSTHASTPRKHAHPEPSQCPRFDITLGHNADDRIVTAKWTSGDLCAMVSIDVATLRHMIALADNYKPGATIGGAS